MYGGLGVGGVKPAVTDSQLLPQKLSDSLPKCILMISGTQFQRPFPRLCWALHPIHVGSSTVHVGKIF